MQYRGRTGVVNLGYRTTLLDLSSAQPQPLWLA